jgi:hypothetical protein
MVGVGLLIAAEPWIRSGGVDITIAWWSLGLAVVLIQSMYVAIEFEYSRAASFTSATKDRPPDAPRVVAVLLPLGLAAIVAYYFFVVPAATAVGFDANTGTSEWSGSPWQEAVVLVLIAGLGVLVNWRLSRSDQCSVHILTGPVILACGAAASWIGVLVVTFSLAQGLGPLYIIAASVVSFLLALLTTESILTNPGPLQDLRVTTKAVILAITGGLSVFCSVMWLTLSGVWSGPIGASLPAALGAAAAAYVGGYGIALCCGLIVSSGGRDPQLTEDPAWFNISQDQLLYCGLAFFGVWSGALAIARSTKHSGLEILPSIMQVATYLGPFALFFAFTLVNNWKHFSRQSSRIHQLADDTGRPTDPKRWVRRLQIHMLLQTVISIMVAIIAIVGAVGTILGATVSTFLKHLLPKDI